jgi:hypothetical protein
MSWSENGRKNRMTKVMELLKLNRQGLSLQVIARETGKNLGRCRLEPERSKGVLPFSFLPDYSKRSLSSVWSCTLKSSNGVG